ncbi:MAG TPA: DCC1-like thiol-disulfide oxidoreductase family protein [Flavobacteriales bacterium]|nr:DCC1-like thiol-disulfide oxidoreductase family protein [Flavobacteriales bacterium]HQW42313.1 DCC1-like thiol-disulfide oxidoreductase family protein [Flavobacteriales bacterium]
MPELPTPPPTIPQYIPTGDRPIVFFDGYCGLCNGFVDRLLIWDKDHTLRFSPLQGDTAGRILPAPLRQDLGTVVLAVDDQIHTRSSAALRTLMLLGGGWKLAAVFLLVPPFLRNAVYDLIARNRYQWFGKHDACRIPSHEERSLFLP